MEKIEALCSAKHSFSASDMQQQVFYSTLDQRLHNNDFNNGISTTDILNQVQHECYGLPIVQNTVNWTHYRLLSFVQCHFEFTFRFAIAGLATPIQSLSRLWRQILFLFAITGCGSMDLATVFPGKSFLSPVW